MLRGVLWFLWKKKLSAQAAAKEICAVLGEGTLHRRTAAKWFHRFNNGDTSLVELPRSGRPVAAIDEQLLEAVKVQPHASVRVLASELGTSKSTISCHLKSLGVRQIRPKQDPHDLTPQQAQRRLELCTKLLENPTDDRFWKRIVTGDEKWIFFKNPDKEKQWVVPGGSAQSVVRQDRYGAKVMLCVWWNFEGIVHFELLRPGVTVNAGLYQQQIDRVYEVLKERYPGMVNRGRVVWQHDNAPAHSSKTTKCKLEELEGIEVLPHPAYSPDLAPSDYGLFRSMAHFLRGRQFANYEDVKIGCQEFFDSKSPAWYHNQIRQLAERWATVVDHNGLYFEE